MRLGTGPRLLSRPGLRTHDARLPFETRQLSVSLVCLRDLLAEAGRLGIRFYRMAAQTVPVLGENDLPGFRRQLDGCLALAELVGAEARALGTRLTVHPALDVQLGSSDERVARRGMAVATAWEALLAAMGLGADACIVVHRGGSGPAADAAFVRRVQALPIRVRERLALENDERCCSLGAALWLSGETGIPVVWDYLHWRCTGTRGQTPRQAYLAAAATWPAGMTAKLHYSSPRTAASRGHQPPPRAHAEYIDPFAFHDFVTAVTGPAGTAGAVAGSTAGAANGVPATVGAVARTVGAVARTVGAVGAVPGAVGAIAGTPSAGRRGADSCSAGALGRASAGARGVMGVVGGVEAARDGLCDVMLEAGAKDLALLKLRRDLAVIGERGLPDLEGGVCAAG